MEQVAGTGPWTWNTLGAKAHPPIAASLEGCHGRDLTAALRILAIPVPASV